jgi:hypothetical protein
MGAFMSQRLTSRAASRASHAPFGKQLQGTAPGLKRGTDDQDQEFRSCARAAGAFLSLANVRRD